MVLEYNYVAQTALLDDHGIMTSAIFGNDQGLSGGEKFGMDTWISKYADSCYMNESIKSTTNSQQQKTLSFHSQVLFSSEVRVPTGEFAALYWGKPLCCQNE